MARILLTDGKLEDNRFLAEFEHYGLLDVFWRECGNCFGYIAPKPTLEKLVITLFVTYTEKYVRANLPPGWEPFISYKPGNIMVFLDSLKNHILHQEAYDRLSAHVETRLSVASAFGRFSTDSYIECDTFLCVDQLLVAWLNERLLNEDVGAKLAGHTIPEICE